MTTLTLPRSDGRERVLFVTDRLMHFSGGLWSAEQVKAMFCAGEHEIEKGYLFRVTEDAIPDDAVISGPEQVDEFLWRYSVISDSFSPDQPLNLMPRCEKARG